MLAHWDAKIKFTKVKTNGAVKIKVETTRLDCFYVTAILSLGEVLVQVKIEAEVEVRLSSG